MYSVAYPAFIRLWRSLLPAIVIMKPMTDLCWECQRNRAAILRAANCPDTEKSATLKKAKIHLLLVQKERSFYKSILDECRHAVHDFFSSMVGLLHHYYYCHSLMQTRMLLRCIIPLTLHRQYTFHQTLFNPDQSTF